MIAPAIESESEYIKSLAGSFGASERARGKLKGGKQVFALIIALNSFVHSRKTFPCCPCARAPSNLLVWRCWRKADSSCSRGRRFSEPTNVSGELDGSRKKAELMKLTAFGKFVSGNRAALVFFADFETKFGQAWSICFVAKCSLEINGSRKLLVELHYGHRMG